MGTHDGLVLTNFFDKKTWKKIFTSWPFYAFSLGNVGGFNASNSQSGSFALWLQSLNRYSIPKLNKLTAIPPALGIIWLIITTTGADLTRKRFLMIVFAQLMNFIANIILAVWMHQRKPNGSPSTSVIGLGHKVLYFILYKMMCLDTILTGVQLNGY